MKRRSIVPYLVHKYLRFDRSQPFITISAILAFLGVSIGLMVLIIAMAIMNGTSKEFQSKISTMSYPITIMPIHRRGVDIYALEALRKKFPSFIFSPYLTSQAIVKKGENMEGSVIFGVEFAQEAKINHILAEALEGHPPPKGYEMVSGKGIAGTLGLKEGEKVTLIFTDAQPGGFTLIPTMKRFVYRGSFSSGIQAYDNAYVYTPITSLAKVLKVKPGVFDGIHVSSAHPMEDIKRIRAFLPDYLGAIGWWQENGNLFSAMAMEKRALFIVLMLIILVASLNIVSSLLMTVMNRRREIALLLSLGASKAEIKKSFFLLGSVIGGAGILFGTFLGLLGIFLLGHFDIVTLPADVYGTSKLPLDLSVGDFFSILAGAIIIVLLSSYYPSRRASNIDALQTLRNE